MKRFTVIETNFFKTKAEIVLSGNIEDYEKDYNQFRNHAFEAIKEHFDYKKIVEKKVKYTNLAYSCSKFEDGVDANDEGYAFFINYYKDWKPGLGKCVSVMIFFNVIGDVNVLNSEVEEKE